MATAHLGHCMNSLTPTASPTLSLCTFPPNQSLQIFFRNPIARLFPPPPLTSSPFITRAPNSSSDRRRTLSRCAFEKIEASFEQEEGESEEEGRGGDDFYLSDFESLEEEASDVAREYSRSLSRELSIEDGTYEKKETVVKQRSQRRSNKHIPNHLLPRVAIVGRPNVGKSALFNRLVGGNRAIVVDEPGVTRDRLYGRSFWGDNEFMVVDTGGVMTFSKSQTDVMEELQITTTVGMDAIPLASREAAVARMPSMVERQAAAAVEEAAVIIFLVDGQIATSLVDLMTYEESFTRYIILCHIQDKSKLFWLHSWLSILLC